MNKMYWFRGRMRKMQKMRSFMWRGFCITIYNNHLRGFQYEWKCVPVSQQAKRLAGQNTLYDPTSSRTFHSAVWYAKSIINCCYQPFYYTDQAYKYNTERKGLKYFIPLEE